MRFLRYAGKRLLFLIPQLIAVSIIVFFLVRLLPGDPAFLMAGQFATKERIEEVRRDLGLDRPLAEQYVIYVGNVLRGDFGKSWRTSQNVTADIRQRLPATLELVLCAASCPCCSGCRSASTRPSSEEASPIGGSSCTGCSPDRFPISGSG